MFVAAVAFGLCSARAADDAEDVKKKIAEAKKEFDGEVQKLQKAVADSFDKREAEARRVGNKKLVDEIRAERERFEKSGALPADPPKAAQAQVTAARVKLDKTYSGAVRDLIKLREDTRAEETEKEQQKVVTDAALRFGKRTYLGALKAFDVKTYNNLFEKDTDRFKIRGEPVPHSLFMHPTTRSFATVSYALAGKATLFHAVVGIPKQERINEPASALTFEVMGDGKSLWKSEPVKTRDAFQTCVIKVEKVKTLTLRVHCPDDQASAHAVWFGPFVVE